MKIQRWLLMLVAAVALCATQTGKPTDPARGSTGAQRSSATKGGLVDINSASEQELDALPGIGPVMAQKIIGGRPYRAKTDLINRKVIPQSTYDKIKGQIIAHQKK